MSPSMSQAASHSFAGLAEARRQLARFEPEPPARPTRTELRVVLSALAGLGLLAAALALAPPGDGSAPAPAKPVLSDPQPRIRTSAAASSPQLIAQTDRRIRGSGPVTIRAGFAAPALRNPPAPPAPIRSPARDAPGSIDPSAPITPPPGLRASAEPVVVRAPNPARRFPPAAPPATPWREHAARFVDDGRPLLAIVIDDVGPDRAGVARLQALPREITFAILPYAQAAAELAEAARAQDREVLVHMPMEPRGLDDPGPNSVRVGLSAGEIRQRVRWAFARVPGAVGLNNHMGSRVTADAPAMRALARALAERDRVFLDSLTTGSSVALSAAKEAGVDALVRDVFLDHDPRRAAVARKLADAARAARDTGAAVAIGHPRDASLDALEAWLSTEDARSVRLAPLSAVWARQANNASGRLLAQAL